MFDGFKTFMFKHKIPATAAAFSVGGASAEMAKTMSTDIILPVLLYTANLAFPKVTRQPIRLWPFFGTVVSWACVLVTSYILMELVFSRAVLGASLVVMDKTEEHEYEKAQNITKEPIKQASRAIKDFVANGIESAKYATVDSKDAPIEPHAYDKSDHCVAPAT